MPEYKTAYLQKLRQEKTVVEPVPEIIEWVL